MTSVVDPAVERALWNAELERAVDAMAGARQAYRLVERAEFEAQERRRAVGREAGRRPSAALVRAMRKLAAAEATYLAIRERLLQSLPASR